MANTKLTQLPNAPTLQYEALNLYVSGLPRRTIDAAGPSSFLGALPAPLLGASRAANNLRRYIHEIVKGRSWLYALLNTKGSMFSKEALLIGNGPSQGYLDSGTIKKFQDMSGDVFVVNYWNLNPMLADVSPNYLVLSDPLTLNFGTEAKNLVHENEGLLNFLIVNSCVRVICPISRCQDIAALIGKNRVIGFCDTPLKLMPRSTNPLLPRSYVSMTLFKALAVAKFFGYKRIFILGMDNTYPRNIFCDDQNRILNLEQHAGKPDYVVDQSGRYASVADLLDELANLFRDAKKFADDKRVLNLDIHSLTDAFPKIPFETFKKCIQSGKMPLYTPLN
jgi:hypothetical protein